MSAKKLQHFVVLFTLLVLLVPVAFCQRWHASVTPESRPQEVPPLDDMAHTSWTRRDGAPGDITALAQTADGYLWIGSGLGLYRFDGLRFLPYPFNAADPRLPSSDIATLAASPDGGLWIGYRMGGITYLHGSKKIDFDQKSGLVSQSTEQLICLKDGSVWAVADGRLMHLQGSHWENYSRAHGLASEGLYSLFFDHHGNLWTAEKQHIYELKPGAAVFEEILVRNHTVNQFAELTDGTLWISDAWINARSLQDETGKQAVRIPGVPVMLADKGGNIWLAHDFGGLTRITSPGTSAQKAENFKAVNGLTDGQTRAILQDKQGAIWVGTARGLDRFQHSPLIRFHAAHLDYFPALLADPKGGIWLNDMDKPLMRFQNGQLRALDSIAHGSSSLFQDSRGGVWLLDPISHNFFRYTDDGRPPLRIPAPSVASDVETWCIGDDAQGNLLASFEGHGLWRYSGVWKQLSGPGLPEDAPLSLLRRKDGAVWLGYPHNRVALLDANGFHVYGSQDGLELNTVLAFYELNGHMLAAGSDGFASFDGKQFHSLQLRTANLLRGISGIVKDQQNDLWLNAASGIIHISASDWQAALKNPHFLMDFQSLNERDGLMGTPAQNKPTPSAVMDKDGVLWFATSGHLVSIHPAQVHWGEEGPNVQIQTVLINGAVRSLGDVPSVAEDGRRLKSLEFDYIGIDLNAADRVTYQYKLEAQDREWQDAGTRGQAFYTNLAPGIYRFRVRATNGTGKWNELQSPLTLRVKPAFYQTAWFAVLSASTLLAVLWIIYQKRVDYLTEQARQRVETRAQERLSIARDLHDTLLQGIQGLVLRFHYATEQIKNDDAARDMLRIALSRADQVINEGREKVRELRSGKGVSRDLPRQLLELAETLQTETDCSIEFIAKGEGRVLTVAAQDEIFSIAREALTNAIRHASATKINLELSFEKTQLRMICMDDGEGLNPEIAKTGSKKGHYGLLGMRERAARLDCELLLWSSQGAGTRVEIIAPAHKAYAGKIPFLRLRALDRLSLLVHPDSKSQGTLR
jgi:signal transduction histidine kinase/ligand-binding sensor domain-containing protein